MNTPVKNQDKAQPSIANTSGNPQKNAQNRKIAGALVILCVVVAIGAVLYLKDNNQTSTDPQTYSYNSTQKVIVAGSSSGKGMSFLRPSVFKDVATDSTNAKAVFTQLKKLSGSENYVDIAGMMGRVQDFNDQKGPSAEYSNILRTNFNDPSSKDYEQAVKTVEFTIKNFYKSATVENIAKPRAFTNQNITKDAWSFDYSTKGQNGSPDQTGVAVVAIGKNGLYYYLVSAETSNWQNNKSFFDTLLSSIQIDI